MAMTPERWRAERPHLPWPLVTATASSISTEQIYNARYRRVRDEDATTHGGFILPPFQRPPAWDDARRARYVESLYLGLQGMPIVWNDAGEAEGPDGGPHPTEGWLIDGQQRIGAILAYVLEGLEVFGGTEHGHRWSDLSGAERGVFARIQIPSVRIASSDAGHLEEIYRRLAFGGVPHLPE